MRVSYADGVGGNICVVEQWITLRVRGGDVRLGKEGEGWCAVTREAVR